MPRQTAGTLNLTRTAIVKALRSAGRPVERIPGYAENYRFSGGGRTARMRLLKKNLVTGADGYLVSDAINLERGEDELVIAGVRDRFGGLEVYVVPKPRVIADMRAHQAHYLAANPAMNDPAAWKDKTFVRSISFDGDPAHPGKGFRQKYREFLVATANVNELADFSTAEPAPTGDESALELALRKTAIAASFEYGRPVSSIRITISVMFRTGELAFHWPALASGGASRAATTDD